jgi:hypothetical protein
MKTLAACLVALLALCAIPLLAQSAGNDTLTALLSEVRLLRQALERNASAPQVQLLGTRLTIQNARLTAAVKDHDAVRNELQNAVDAIAQLTADLTASEQPGPDRTPEHQVQMDVQRAAMKTQLAALGTSETQLRAREAELAAALAEEQNQWLLLNRRVDEIERSLAR